MDTRTKIVRLEDAPRGEWLAVVGLFDPLTATQAARMADFAGRGRPLLAVVLDQAGTLFEVEARAALMAALRSVRLVAIAKPGEWRAKLTDRWGEKLEIIEDAAGEYARSAEFVQLILNRAVLNRDGLR